MYIVYIATFLLFHRFYIIVICSKMNRKKIILFTFVISFIYYFIYMFLGLFIIAKEFYCFQIFHTWTATAARRGDSEDQLKR